MNAETRQKREWVRRALVEYGQALNVEIGQTDEGTEQENLEACVIEVAAARRVLWMSND